MEILGFLALFGGFGFGMIGNLVVFGAIFWGIILKIFLKTS